MRQDNRIVCNCNMVKAHQVYELTDAFPHFTPETIISTLEIGRRCGTCLRGNNPAVDINIHKLLKP